MGGGNVLEQRFLPFHLPDISDAEVDAAVATLRSGWLTTGPKTAEFEQRFAAYVDARYAIAVNSCTAALHLALDAVHIGAGDEVIVPTMTFAATAEVVKYCGARPILVDSEPVTLNIDPLKVEAAITPKTKAIIAVHFAGHPCEMETLVGLARERHLSLVEDAAHCLPSSYRGRKIGSIGDVTCFSFYATKTMTTGEGGMAVTDDPVRAERIRMMSLHGISKDAWNRYSMEGLWYYEILEPGFKYNLTDIASAIGVEQLKRVGRFLERRQQIRTLYDDAFAELDTIHIPCCLPHVQHSWHLYPIKLDLEKLKIGRNEFIEHLKEAGIGVSVHFIPLHLHPYYRMHFGFVETDFPIASDAYKRLISLPIYSLMTNADAERVVAAVTKIARENRR